jgi:branched-chain amino acid transport system substrate-binding protein
MPSDALRDSASVAGSLGELPAIAAYVTRSGQLIEHNDGRGRRALEQDPALARHVAAMLACALDELRFLWRAADGGWAAVGAQRVAATLQHEEAALVELHPLDVLPYGLTPREAEVLTLLAGGLGNAEIATHLGTSARTTSTQVATILAKLDQVTRAGAASMAVEQGLLRLPVAGGGHAIARLAIGQVDIVVRRSQQLRSVVGPALPRRGSRPRPLLIGGLLPLSGPMGADGHEMQNGSRLAIAEINARGGIAGRPIEQLVVDVDIDDPHAIDDAIRRLVDAEVDAITTGYTFSEDPARYDAVAAYGCPLLTTETSEVQAELVRSDRSRLAQVFQVGPTESHYVAGFVRFLDDLVAAGSWRPANRRLAIVETPLPGGHVSTPEAIDAIEQAGWKLDTVHSVGGYEVDWTTLLTQIRASAPAAVMLAHFVPGEAAEFQRAFVADPTDTLIYGVYAQSVPEYAQLAGAAADGVLWGTVTGSYSDRIGEAFARQYEAAYGVRPGRSQAGLSYDQVSLLSLAWARVGNPRAFDAVGDELRRIAHRGINGTYVLGHDRQCGLNYPYDTPDPSLGQAHLVFQLRDGVNRIVHPTLYADGAFALPPWFTG